MTGGVPVFARLILSKKPRLSSVEALRALAGGQLPRTVRPPVEHNSAQGPYHTEDNVFRRSQSVGKGVHTLGEPLGRFRFTVNRIRQC